MKTQETLKAALSKIEKDADKIDHQLDVVSKLYDGDLETINVPSFEDKTRVVTFLKEKQELVQKQKEIAFKIRFLKWVLE